MPTYEYACPDCGIIEVFQSMSEKPLTRCPQCKKRKVARMVSGGAGVIFKGSGFWETDYNRSEDYKKKSKPEGEAASEPKPASKTQAAPKPATPGAATPSTPKTTPPSTPPAGPAPKGPAKP